MSEGEKQLPNINDPEMEKKIKNENKDFYGGNDEEKNDEGKKELNKARDIVWGKYQESLKNDFQNNIEERNDKSEDKRFDGMVDNLGEFKKDKINKN